MPDHLETTFDKFTFRVATDRHYSREGLWVLEIPDCGRVRVGLADDLQQRNGDVAFLTVQPLGSLLRIDDPFAEMETVKITVALPSPVGGEIVACNDALDLGPEVVNQDPYGDGWLAEIAVADWEGDQASLLDAAAYLALMKARIEAVLAK